MQQIGSKVRLKGFPVIQNEQEFIIGKIAIHEILQFTRYTERLIIGYDDNEIPIYNKNVQRKVESVRVENIADYLINNKEATFPTNIVLGVPINIIEKQTVNDEIITIKLIDKVTEQVHSYILGDSNADIFISIIDGQHRIKGIEVAIDRLKKSINENGKIINAEEKLQNLLNIELVVSYFIDKSLEYQAMIFSTINRTQKRVSQNLVLSLFGLTTNDTPYKTALEVVLALNGHVKSPFHKRVKLYGGNYDRKESPPLSQATMIRSIVALISETLRESENDRSKNRKELKVQNGSKFLPFRGFYANDNDGLISDCLFFFFNSVKKHLYKHWEYDGISKPVNILQSTIGYEVLLKLLVSILRFNQHSDSFDSSTFDVYVSRLTSIEFDDVNIFPMATSSKKRLYLEMYVLAIPEANDIEEMQEELTVIKNK